MNAYRSNFGIRDQEGNENTEIGSIDLTTDTQSVPRGTHYMVCPILAPKNDGQGRFRRPYPSQMTVT